MYLLLGDPQDPLCQVIRTSIEVLGHQARIVAKPMAGPLRFAWRLGDPTSNSELIWEDGTCLSDSEISGVLVRRPGSISAEGWNPEDLAYLQAETEAALLAWLWSLKCPVVNRCPPALWYRPDPSLLFWQPWLEQCGLRALNSMISNVEQEIRSFGAGLGREAVYAPLTAEARYGLASDERWNQLVALLRLVPVHLTQAFVAVHSACVVGQHVVWGGRPPPDANTLEPRLTRFSTISGLAFFEIAITPTADDTRVAAVYPYPRLEHFDQAAQREIAVNLVQLLMEGSGCLHAGSHEQFQ
jgi:hypothetical protein